MPFLTCPYCSEPAWVVRIVEGAEVTCKRCQRPFLPDGDASGSTTAVKGRPIEAPKRESRPAPWRESQGPNEIIDEEDAGTIASWRKVHLGISLIAAGLWIGVIGLVFACCGTAQLGYSAITADRFDKNSITTLLIVVFGILLLRLLFQVGGISLCLFAPRVRGAKALAAVCLALSIGSIAIGLSQGISHAFAAGDTLSPADWSVYLIQGRTDAFALMSSLMDFVHLIVFFFFLRAVALAIHDDHLLATVRQVLIVGGTVLGLLVAMVAVALIAGPRGDGEGPNKASAIVSGLFCTVGILAIGWFIWYLVALGKSRTALTNYIHQRMHE